MTVKNISLAEASYDIWEFWQNNILNGDWTDIRQCQYWINSTRAKLLKQKFDKESTYNIDEHFVQEISINNSGVPMEVIDSSVVSSIPSGRYISRTSISIPATIERTNRIGTFTRIGPADGLGERYPLITYENALVWGNGKFNQDSIAAFLLGDRICLISKNPQSIRGVTKISVRGVFQNAIEAAKLTNPLWTEDNDYPINLSMIDDMKSIILGEDFRAAGRIPVDPQPANQETLDKKD